MPTVVLIGALEQRGRAYEFVRTRLVGLGVDAILVDAGLRGIPAAAAEITRDDVARAAGADPFALRREDLAVILTTMARGAAEVATRLRTEGLLDAVFAVGGSTTTTLLRPALRALPPSVPHLMLSTDGSSPSLQLADQGLSLLAPADDPLGIDGIPEATLTTGAGAIAGMAMAALRFPVRSERRRLVGVRTIDATRNCPRPGRDRLQTFGHDVIYARAR